MSKPKPKRRKRCEICGELRPDATKKTNPFEEDVSNRTVEQVICNYCYEELGNDI